MDVKDINSQFLQHFFSKKDNRIYQIRKVSIEYYRCVACIIKSDLIHDCFFIRRTINIKEYKKEYQKYNREEKLKRIFKDEN